jgi:hypothetical protein
MRRLRRPQARLSVPILQLPTWGLGGRAAGPDHRDGRNTSTDALLLSHPAGIFRSSGFGWARSGSVVSRSHGRPGRVLFDHNRTLNADRLVKVFGT